MRRIVKEHAERRTELLEIAARIFTAKGFEAATIGDIIAEAGVAKGTFYHYFPSKFALLDELVTYRMSRVLEPVKAIADDPGLDAVTKFNRVFAAIQQWKYQNRELMLTALEAIFSEDNAVTQFKSRHKLFELFRPVYTTIIHQGISEGVFHTPSAENTAEAVLALFIGLGDTIPRDLITALNEPAGMDRFEARLAVYENAMARILGAPEGSFVFIDRPLLRSFFRNDAAPTGIPAAAET